MKDKIIELLEKYEDLIMKYTLGSKKSEWGEKYADVYCYEWKDSKHDIALTVSEMIKNGYIVSSEGFAYIIIAQWAGVISFEDKDVNIKKIKVLCRKILNELIL